MKKFESLESRQLLAGNGQEPTPDNSIESPSITETFSSAWDTIKNNAISLYEFTTEKVVHTSKVIAEEYNTIKEEFISRNLTEEAENIRSEFFPAVIDNIGKDYFFVYSDGNNGFGRTETGSGLAIEPLAGFGLAVSIGTKTLHASSDQSSTYNPWTDAVYTWLKFGSSAQNSVIYTLNKVATDPENLLNSVDHIGHWIPANAVTFKVFFPTNANEFQKAGYFYGGIFGANLIKNAYNVYAAYNEVTEQSAQGGNVTLAQDTFIKSIIGTASDVTGIAAFAPYGLAINVAVKKNIVNEIVKANLPQTVTSLGAASTIASRLVEMSAEEAESARISLGWKTAAARAGGGVYSTRNTELTLLDDPTKGRMFKNGDIQYARNSAPFKYSMLMGLHLAINLVSELYEHRNDPQYAELSSSEYFAAITSSPEHVSSAVTSFVTMPFHAMVALNYLSHPAGENYYHIAHPIKHIVYSTLISAVGSTLKTGLSIAYTPYASSVESTIKTSLDYLSA